MSEPSLDKDFICFRVESDHVGVNQMLAREGVFIDGPIEVHAGVAVRERIAPGGILVWAG